MSPSFSSQVQQWSQNPEVIFASRVEQKSGIPVSTHGKSDEQKVKEKELEEEKRPIVEELSDIKESLIHFQHVIPSIAVCGLLAHPSPICL